MTKSNFDNIPPTDDENYQMMLSDDIAPMLFHQDFIDGEIKYGEVSKKNIIRKDEYQYGAIVSAEQQDFSSNIKYPRDAVAALSLDDYQSICAGQSLTNISIKLVSAYAHGDKEEVEKICPGFSEKYANKIEGKSVVSVDMETFEDIRNDVKENFSDLCPDFLQKTENKWNTLRSEGKIYKNIEINDYIYYAIVSDDAVTISVSDEHTKRVADIRKDNNEVVGDLKSHKTLKKQMKKDAQEAIKVKRRMESMIKNMNKINGPQKSIDPEKTTDIIYKEYRGNAYSLLFKAIQEPTNYAKMVDDENITTSREAVQHLSDSTTNAATRNVINKLLEKDR